MNGEELSRKMEKEISDRLFKVETSKTGWYVISENDNYKVKAFYWRG